MEPNAVTDHNPDPARLRALLAEAGITMAAAAKCCGVSLRTLERYLSVHALKRGDWCPYPLQFTIEALCSAPGHRGRKHRSPIKHERGPP